MCALFLGKLSTLELYLIGLSNFLVAFGLVLWIVSFGDGPFAYRHMPYAQHMAHFVVAGMGETRLADFGPSGARVLFPRVSIPRNFCWMKTEPPMSRYGRCPPLALAKLGS